MNGLLIANFFVLCAFDSNEVSNMPLNSQAPKLTSNNNEQ